MAVKKKKKRRKKLALLGLDKVDKLGGHLMADKRAPRSEADGLESFLHELRKKHELKEVAAWESGCSGLSRSFRSPNSPMKGELKEISIVCPEFG